MAFSYLPNIDSDKLYNIFVQKKWDELNSELKNCDYERMGFDRLFLILSDLQYRFGNEKLSVLDVGCNNGIFSYGLAAMGYAVTGIDNGIIDTQNRYDELQFIDCSKPQMKLDFIDGKIEDYLKQTDKRWDCLLLLSVLHQFENGYAFDEKSKYAPEEIKQLVNELFSRGKKVIYYECPYDEPGFEFLSGMHFLERYVENLNRFHIEEIAKTVGPNGVIRQLYAILPRNEFEESNR